MIENLPYVVLSRQTTLQRQLDVVANNLANMTTTGFKRERTLFETYLIDTENSFHEDLSKVHHRGEQSIFVL